MPDIKKNLGFYLFLVTRAHHKLATEVFERISLHRAQPPVLFTLGRQDGMTQSELAEILEVSQPTITNLLHRMETAGLIRRNPDSSDSRISRVFLTETGRNVLAQAEDLAGELDGIVFSGFSPDERQHMKTYLERIHTNITKY